MVRRAFMLQSFEGIKRVTYSRNIVCERQRLLCIISVACMGLRFSNSTSLGTANSFLIIILHNIVVQQEINLSRARAFCSLLRLGE